MKSKQELLVDVLKEKLDNAKIGIIVRGIIDIDPIVAIKSISLESKKKYYVAFVGYDTKQTYEDDSIVVSNMIEDAVRWRSKPELAGKVIAFVKNDSEKLHSLAEFDTVTTRDISLQLIQYCVSEATNAPTEKFWVTLKDSSSYYSFDVLYEFVEAVYQCSDKNDAILN